MVTYFTNKQIQVLRALGKYKFLTYDQMLLLKIDKHKSNLATTLKTLRDGKRALILKIPHSFGETSRYYLSRRGGKVLLNLCKDLSAKDLQIPKGIVTKATQDAIHREMIITTQIQLNLACVAKNVKSDYCKRYFDKAGNPKQRTLKSETAILYEEGKTLKTYVSHLKN